MRAFELIPVRRARRDDDWAAREPSSPQAGISRGSADMLAAALNALAGLVLAVNGQQYDGGGETVSYLNVAGSDITVTNVHVYESPTGINGVTISGNRNTLRNITVERAGAAGVYFTSGSGHVLEDSVIRDPVRRAGIDSWGIYSAAAGAITIRRTTVHGSGFSIYAPGGSVVLEDNHLVVPDSYRTDCNGQPDANGPCQCAEFGIALKSGNAVIRHNWISGYRTADPVCGGTGAPGAGIAVAACATFETCPTLNVRMESNVISNSHAGVYVGPRSGGVVVQANRFCGSDYGISDGFGAPSSIIDNEFLGNQLDLNLYGTRSGPVSGNSVASEGCVEGSYPAAPLVSAPTGLAPTVAALTLAGPRSLRRPWSRHRIYFRRGGAARPR